MGKLISCFLFMVKSPKIFFFKNTVASYWKEGIDNFITGEEELKNLKKEVDDRKPLTRELAKNM